MRHRPHNRLPRWHRRLVYALTTVLVITGLAWLYVVYLLAAPGEATPAPHPLGGPLLAAHGVAAYVALFAFALVGHAHMRTGWKVAPLRGAAFGLCSLMLALVLTGLAFYYVANEAATPWVRWGHAAAGVGLPCALAWHVIRGRRETRRG